MGAMGDTVYSLGKGGRGAIGRGARCQPGQATTVNLSVGRSEVELLTAPATKLTVVARSVPSTVAVMVFVSALVVGMRRAFGNSRVAGGCAGATYVGITARAWEDAFLVARLPLSLRPRVDQRGHLYNPAPIVDALRRM